MNDDEIGYALSKQVPDMRHGVTLETNYGSLFLQGSDAEAVAALVHTLLLAKLKSTP